MTAAKKEKMKESATHLPASPTHRAAAVFSSPKKTWGKAWEKTQGAYLIIEQILNWAATLKSVFERIRLLGQQHEVSNSTWLDAFFENSLVPKQAPKPSTLVRGDYASPVPSTKATKNERFVRGALRHAAARPLEKDELSTPYPQEAFKKYNSGPNDDKNKRKPLAKGLFVQGLSGTKYPSLFKEEHMFRFFNRPSVSEGFLEKKEGAEPEPPKRQETLSQHPNTLYGGADEKSMPSSSYDKSVENNETSPWTGYHQGFVEPPIQAPRNEKSSELSSSTDMPYPATMDEKAPKKHMDETWITQLLRVLEEAVPE